MYVHLSFQKAFPSIQHWESLPIITITGHMLNCSVCFHVSGSLQFIKYFDRRVVSLCSAQATYKGQGAPCTALLGAAAWQGERLCCRLWSGSDDKNGDSLSLKAWAAWCIYVSTSQIIAMCWLGSLSSGGKNGEALLSENPQAGSPQ